MDRLPQLQPGWHTSLISAGLLLGVVVVVALLQRRVEQPWLVTVRAFAREFTVIMSLLALWQFVGGYVHTRVAGAMDRGQQIAALQAAWHLPSEQAVQRLVLPHAWLVRGLDIYYAYAHLNGMAFFVVWLWWRHRDAYPRMRFTMIVSTLACLLVQLVPVAPPRLLPGLGFVDTALVNGQSVYGEFGTGLANQLSAMPSVHVGWAALVGWYVWWSAPRGWRWIGPLHTMATVLVVVATANHWWLDGLVAVGFDALAMLIGSGVSRLSRSPWMRWQRPPGADPDGGQVPEPVVATS
ncbi:MAG TPA: phosphatase PAP2 family protein [Kineosporiaceae bacterium]|nr:phosphatase PAP2 family protein [Kineosporiaceae bacterium]